MRWSLSQTPKFRSAVFAQFAVISTRPRQDGAVAPRAAASGWLVRLVGAYALAWVAGVCPVEPHTEVADHGRVYDGNCRPGRSRSLDPAGGGSRGRAAGGADVALRRGGGRAGAEPLAGSALLL